MVGAVRRLAGQGGDPVVQLQTNFGGGKTHSMLALYHLFSGTAPSDLPGIEAVVQGGAGPADPRRSGAWCWSATRSRPAIPSPRQTARSSARYGASWRGSWAARKPSHALPPMTKTPLAPAMRCGNSSRNTAPAWSSSTNGSPTPASYTTRATFPPAASRPSSVSPRC